MNSLYMFSIKLIIFITTCPCSVSFLHVIALTHPAYFVGIYNISINKGFIGFAYLLQGEIYIYIPLKTSYKPNLKYYIYL